jgi:Animal haem peroxidase
LDDALSVGLKPIQDWINPRISGISKFFCYTSGQFSVADANLEHWDAIPREFLNSRSTQVPEPVARAVHALGFSSVRGDAFMSKGHGKGLRGLDGVPQSSIKVGLFGRMFRWLEPANHDQQALIELGTAMSAPGNGKPLDVGKPIGVAEPEDENPTIPSGYTYLGQFIDHDITFDPASSLQQQNDPNSLEDFRTPRFDLDSVYGRGPDDQPYLYHGDKLVLGANVPPGPHGFGATQDLQRSKAGVALIGDKRNDENLIVNQLHALMLKFHNKVVDDTDTFPSGNTQSRFLVAQRAVRWHYQWIVIHDFLRRIVGDETLKDVLKPDELKKFGAYKPNLMFYTPESGAYMPVEFSVAAYRLGHSMVRPSYALNKDVVSARSDAKKTSRIPIFNDSKEHFENLNGFRPFPPAWGLDWSFFFDGLNPPAGINHLPQPSYRIDTTLVDPLQKLPDKKIPVALGQGRMTRSLPVLNLVRGLRLGLPSGEAVAQAMGLTPLTPDQVFTGERQQFKDVFAGNTPLWYYILREAEMTTKPGVLDVDEKGMPTGLGGHCLGQMGGRIVAEVFVGLAYFDHHSWLYQARNWVPPLANQNGHFTMTELIKYVG